MLGLVNFYSYVSILSMVYRTVAISRLLTYCFLFDEIETIVLKAGSGYLKTSLTYVGIGAYLNLWNYLNPSGNARIGRSVAE